jgi:NAD(P)-dependent dehydrogenase (short-subunit alcohol dehydrogenase family)
MAGFYPQDDLPIYAAGKASVIHFGRGVQAALMPKDGPPQIRINTICPAASPTGMVLLQAQDPARKARTEEMMKSYYIPIERLADAMLMAVEEEGLAGETIRVTPKGGIETWDFKTNKRKELLAKI